MKRLIFSLSSMGFMMLAAGQNTQNNPGSNHGNKFEQMGNIFPTPNEYRLASGAPGPKYWQNRADYKLNCSLDTAKHSVSGTVEISYTNNSPDNLKFLWLQLDQNIYRKDSRASATITESGGRWANAKFTDG